MHDEGQLTLGPAHHTAHTAPCEPRSPAAAVRSDLTDTPSCHVAAVVSEVRRCHRRPSHFANERELDIAEAKNRQKLVSRRAQCEGEWFLFLTLPRNALLVGLKK